jgi:hypothetical protein
VLRADYLTPAALETARCARDRRENANSSCSFALYINTTNGEIISLISEFISAVSAVSSAAGVKDSDEYSVNGPKDAGKHKDTQGRGKEAATSRFNICLKNWSRP